jgi:hypothetical protein
MISNALTNPCREEEVTQESMAGRRIPKLDTKERRKDMPIQELIMERREDTEAREDMADRRRGSMMKIMEEACDGIYGGEKGGHSNMTMHALKLPLLNLLSLLLHT